MRGFSEGKSEATRHKIKIELITDTVLILYGVTKRFFMEIIVSSKALPMHSKQAMDMGLYWFELNSKTQKIKFFYNKECYNDKGDCVVEMDIATTKRNKDLIFRNIVKFDKWRKLLNLLEVVPEQPVVLEFDGDEIDYQIKVKGLEIVF